MEVGTDDDGDPITSCVVIASEVPPSQDNRGQKLPPTAIAGLRALVECLADRGRPAPYSEHVPRGVTCVTLDEWRDRLFQHAIINKEGSYREQFRRLRVTLNNAAAIGIWEENVWAVT